MKKLVLDNQGSDERKMIFDQSEFDIRCEWGEQGVLQLAPISDAIVIVDVLSFSTCVTVATAQGATVFPYRSKDGPLSEFARTVGAEVARARGKSNYSLSPASLLKLPAGKRIVLPSPNGSTLSLTTGQTPTFAGCLRNAKAVALAAMQYGRKVSVIPAGERWKDDRTLRPAIEDLVGAGAILQHLGGSFSPEACLAFDAYRSARPDIRELLLKCSSGKELIMQGFEQDVILAAAVDVDDCAPLLSAGAYRKA